MTITAVVPRKAYTADGVGTAFTYPFKIIDASEIQVYVNGVLTVSGYMVSGVGDPSGGSVTFTIAPSNGASIILARSTALAQNTDWTANDPDPAESKEQAFDKAMAINQEQAEALG